MRTQGLVTTLLTLALLCFDPCLGGKLLRHDHALMTAEPGNDFEADHTKCSVAEVCELPEAAELNAFMDSPEDNEAVDVPVLCNKLDKEMPGCAGVFSVCRGPADTPSADESRRNGDFNDEELGGDRESIISFLQTGTKALIVDCGSPLQFATLDRNRDPLGCTVLLPLAADNSKCMIEDIRRYHKEVVADPSLTSKVDDAYYQNVFKVDAKKNSVVMEPLSTVWTIQQWAMATLRTISGFTLPRQGTLDTWNVKQFLEEELAHINIGQGYPTNPTIKTAAAPNLFKNYDNAVGIEMHIGGKEVHSTVGYFRSRTDQTVLASKLNQMLTLCLNLKMPSAPAPAAPCCRYGAGCRMAARVTAMGGSDSDNQHVTLFDHPAPGGACTHGKNCRGFQRAINPNGPGGPATIRDYQHVVGKSHKE